MIDHDKELGFDKPPTRYANNGGRETIDLIRDSMSDESFIDYCWGTVIRYRDRTGLKGPAEVDEEKALFYVQMAQHVAHGSPDPRAYRVGFQPYVRQPYPLGKHGVPSCKI